MALSRPTLDALYARAQADFVALSETGGAILRRTAEWVEARIVARVAHGLYAYIDDRKKQSFPDTADEAGLRQWGALFGVVENPATFAQGDVTFAGVGVTSIPMGTEIRIGTMLYTTDASGVISAGTATIAVTASEVGEDGNAPEAATGTLTNPIAGIGSTVTVASGGLTGGTDPEALEAYRARVLARMRNPPRGGTSADYTAWISETPTVSVYKSWVYPAGDGAGTVAAAFVVTDGGGTGFAVADAGEISDVQDYVDEQRPADMRSFRAYTPGAAALTLTIDLTIEPGAVLATVQDAIEASIEALVGATVEPEAAIALSRISEAISTTAGEQSHVITSPLVNPTPGAGNVFTTVGITWV